jgi:8-oxo-dGTP pyrophosphatase MutT (NUDIX family)
VGGRDVVDDGRGKVKGRDDTAQATGEDAEAPGRAASPWQTVAGHQVYRNPWITVTEYAVIRPDGTPGIYGVVDPGHNASVVALDADGQVWLANEYVYPVHDYVLKVASGKVEDGEEPLAAARRELAEELGIVAERWTLLGAYYTSSGISPQTSHLYLARDLTIGEARREGTEDITRLRVPLRAAVDASLRGEIRDATAALALLRTWLWVAAEAGNPIL